MLDLSRRAQAFLKDLQPMQFKQVTNKIISLLRNHYPDELGSKKWTPSLYDLRSGGV
jgi:hypothetical protein